VSLALVRFYGLIGYRIALKERFSDAA
jgi:hypothetical protein